jgi:hypothetical protein
MLDEAILGLGPEAGMYLIRRRCLAADMWFPDTRGSTICRTTRLDRVGFPMEIFLHVEDSAFAAWNVVYFAVLITEHHARNTAKNGRLVFWVESQCQH